MATRYQMLVRGKKNRKERSHLNNAYYLLVTLPMVWGDGSPLYRQGTEVTHL